MQATKIRHPEKYPTFCKANMEPEQDSILQWFFCLVSLVFRHFLNFSWCPFGFSGHWHYCAPIFPPGINKHDLSNSWIMGWSWCWGLGVAPLPRPRELRCRSSLLHTPPWEPAARRSLRDGYTKGSRCGVFEDEGACWVRPPSGWQARLLQVPGWRDQATLERGPRG